MPRPRATLTPNAIPAADLIYAVNELIARGKTSAAEVRAFATAREGRIAELRRELAHLEGGGANGAAVVHRGPDRPPKSATAATAAKSVSTPKRAFTTTPKVIAARKLQGQYLGRLKKLAGSDRARVKAIVKKEGVAAAVAAANKILGAG